MWGLELPAPPPVAASWEPPATGGGIITPGGAGAARGTEVGVGVELNPDVLGAVTPGEGDFQLVGVRIPDFGDAPGRPA
ncbi:hypothetical protein [Mycobacterium sp.]|uniref:hypothetical protein n=1 Tax=Mycobacterium sp. TaxID=1785 RepID=UPI003BA8FC17